jgi:hypothetical protein
VFAPRIPEQSVKHASAAALDELSDLLDDLRKITALKERKRGVFYLKSSAFLHFHEDPAGLFADLRTDAGWERVVVQTKRQRKSLSIRIRSMLT